VDASRAAPFRFDVEGELCARPDRVRNYLEGCFREPDDAGGGFTGRWFERLIVTSDPMAFTPADIVAVSALSVNVPIALAAALLCDTPTRVDATELLQRIPAPGTQLAEVSSAALSDDSPLGRLYRYLRNQPGMGPTVTSKLLAAKRPALVPIRDTVVSNLLGAGTRWWAPMQQVARSDRLSELLCDRCNDVVPADVSLLRRIDVVLWRWGKDTPPPAEI